MISKLFTPFTITLVQDTITVQMLRQGLLRLPLYSATLLIQDLLFTKSLKTNKQTRNKKQNKNKT